MNIREQITLRRKFIYYLLIIHASFFFLVLSSLTHFWNLSLLSTTFLLFKIKEQFLTYTTIIAFGFLRIDKWTSNGRDFRPLTLLKGRKIKLDNVAMRGNGAKRNGKFSKTFISGLEGQTKIILKKFFRKFYNFENGARND